MAKHLEITARVKFLATALCAALTSVQAAANDFPTSERVVYVQECMRAHPGPGFEMLSKCSCALDTLAKKVSYGAYVEMSTAAKATTIGGERGSEIRDNPPLQALIKRYKELQTNVKQSCFIDTLNNK